MLRSFIALLLLLFSFNTKAFCTIDSIPTMLDSSAIKKDSIIAGYFNLHTFNPIQQGYKPFNNSLQNVHEYSPYRFGGYSNLFTLQPFYKKVANKGFYNAHELWDLFYFNPDSAKYFKTRVPYTDLLLVLGTQREQFFKFSYSQNVTRAFNFSASMVRFTSEGHFLKQKMSATNFNVTLNYNSIAQRYGFLISASHRAIKANENGGILASQDSIFRAGGRRQALLINLANANSKRINRYLYMQHFFKLGRKEVSPVNDTTNSVIIHAVSYLSYTFNIDQDWFLFNEITPSLAYYQQNLRNTSETADSTGQLRMVNELAWRVPAGRSLGIAKPLGLLFALSKEDIKFSQVSYDSTGRAKNDMLGKKYKSGFRNTVDNLWLKGELSGVHGKPTAAFNWLLSAKYALDGLQTGDYNAKLDLCKLFSLSLGGVNAFYEVNKVTPAFVYREYSSNNFSWNNTFNKIDETLAGINYVNERFKFSLGFSAVKLNNYVYLAMGADSLITPKQYASSIQINSFNLGKNFTFWKFGFDNKVYYQTLTDSILQLPKFILKSSLYFASKVRGVAELQTGIALTYTSDYYANAYSPGLGMYYLQRSQLIGNYPYVDFFFNVKVQRLRFFFKIEHLNSGFTDGSYYLMPNHPAFDRVFKFGISWKFFD